MIDNDTCPFSEFGHSWEAGMLHVHPEDVASTAAARARFGEAVECSQCEHVYVIGQG